MKSEHRLRSSRDFKRVLAGRRTVARPEFVLYHLPRDERDGPRFGFVVSRRIGGAVVRNRVKRLFREAVRHLAPRIGRSVDVVIVARAPIVEAPLSMLVPALEEAALQAGLLESGPRTDTST